MKDDFKFASDLVKFIKDYDDSFEVLGACYPNIHPESVNRVSDFHYLKEKVDAGCDRLITQLFLIMIVSMIFKNDAQLLR